MCRPEACIHLTQLNLCDSHLLEENVGGFSKLSVITTAKVTAPPPPQQNISVHSAYEGASHHVLLYLKRCQLQLEGCTSGASCKHLLSLYIRH